MGLRIRKEKETTQLSDRLNVRGWRERTESEDDLGHWYNYT